MTLTQASLITRRGVIITSILIVLSLTAKFGFDWYQNYQLSQLPPLEEVAEMKYGALPPVEFPPSNVSSTNYSYSLDTTTGDLPVVPKLIKVYFIPKAGLSLLAPDKARTLAERLGFTQGPTTLSQDEHQFSDQTGDKVIINVNSGNFSYQKTATPSAEVSLPPKDELVEDLKQWLAQKIQLPQEILDGRSSVSYTPEAPGQPPQAQISLWPSNVDEKKIITGNFITGLIRATAIPHQQPEQLFKELTYTYWPVDQTSYSTYSLKTAGQALDDLRSGLGYVAVSPNSPQVSLTSVELAYYQSGTYTPYLQPIYVFEGPSFVALVPAIQQAP